MECQDWTPVTVKRKSSADKSDKRPHLSQEAVHLRKVENDELPKIKTISNTSRQLIVQGRVANGWNQSQLNVACAFPANIIRDIESGKIQPNSQQLNTISRVLKIALKYD